MSDGKTDVAIVAAQARATAARARLNDTLDELKHRASPQTLAKDAAESIKDKGRTAAADLSDEVRRHPATFAAVAGGTLLYLLRHRIAALAHRATGGATGRAPKK